jgi:TldD protein
VATEAAAPLLRLLLDEARSAGCSLIARAQERRRRQILVASGRIDETRALLSRGLGFHLFDADGHTSFAATDGWDEASTRAALQRALRDLQVARKARSVRVRGLDTAERAEAEVHPPTCYPLQQPSVADLANSLLELNGEVEGAVPELRVRSHLGLEREWWRIVRSDGTDVSFSMPRARLTHSLAVGERGKTVTAVASGFAPSAEVLLDERLRAISSRRAVSSGRTLAALLDAETIEGGSWPVVIDHALAKTLAHEALGHAAESDSLRSSILAREGVFRTGQQVAAPEVSVVDEPIEGDWAWQPWDSNGVRRRAVRVVREGILNEALSDLFSAESAGVPVTGAARAESYRSVPIPRMSNIRIEFRGPAPLEIETDDDLEPEQVRQALLREGILDPGRPRVAYLSGFRGGQVNPVTGDFVFNCQAIYELGLEGSWLRRPAIFSGSVLEALRSIRAAFGGLRLDSLGMCGKRGQYVPSSGGSHRLLFLEASPHMRLGGGG